MSDPEDLETRFRIALKKLHNDPAEAARIDAMIPDVNDWSSTSGYALLSGEGVTLYCPHCDDGIRADPQDPSWMVIGDAAMVPISEINRIIADHHTRYHCLKSVARKYWSERENCS